MKPVPGGREVSRPCGPCGISTTHVECDVRDRVSAFFVQFLETTQRRMVCVECGEDLALEEAVAPAPATASPQEPAAAPAPRAPQPHVDDLLAALKKKMGL
jgi:hypothetical protein